MEISFLKSLHSRVIPAFLPDLFPSNSLPFGVPVPSAQHMPFLRVHGSGPYEPEFLLRECLCPDAELKEACS
jgi:hypothetical protein